MGISLEIKVCVLGATCPLHSSVAGGLTLKLRGEQCCPLGAVQLTASPAEASQALGAIDYRVMHAYVGRSISTSAALGDRSERLVLPIEDMVIQGRDHEPGETIVGRRERGTNRRC